MLLHIYIETSKIMVLLIFWEVSLCLLLVEFIRDRIVVKKLVVFNLKQQVALDPLIAFSFDSIFGIGHGLLFRIVGKISFTRNLAFLHVGNLGKDYFWSHPWVSLCWLLPPHRIKRSQIFGIFFSPTKICFTINIE